MSESVSFKVVVIWIIFIFTFACLGVFGFLNQDLIQPKEEEKFIPVVNTDNSIACSTDLEHGNLKYDFVLNNDNTIKNIRITYSANNGTQDEYDTAKKLQEINALGVESTLQGNTSDFLFIIYINMENTDIQALKAYDEDFSVLKITIDNIKKYTDYNNVLHTAHSNIKCEKVTK